jgi:Ankyrin repeats (3 copies)
MEQPPAPQTPEMINAENILFNAIDAGDLAGVRRMIVLRTNLSRRWRGTGLTPLMHAINAIRHDVFEGFVDPVPHRTRLEIVLRLIHPNNVMMVSPDAVRRTPLHTVTLIPERYVIIPMLLNRGANIDAPDTNGDTPLHYAMRLGNFPAIEMLVTRGANMDVENNFHRTPRTIAVANNFTDLLREINSMVPSIPPGPGRGMPPDDEAGGMDRPMGPGGTESIYDPHLVHSITQAIMQRM